MNWRQHHIRLRRLEAETIAIMRETVASFASPVMLYSIGKDSSAITLAASVTGLKHQIDVNSFAKLAAKTLALNEIGVCNLSVARPIPLRSLRREPRHRRLYPDRPLF